MARQEILRQLSSYPKTAHRGAKFFLRFVISITAPILIADQTPIMAHRTLCDMTYNEAVPASGRCSVCGQQFMTPPEALADPQKATWDFYNAFDRHECITQPSRVA